MALKDRCVINARDLPDLWFQAVYEILDRGRRRHIDKGSNAGQERIEFDFFQGHVLQPWVGSGTPDILPQIPPGIVGVPNPVEFAYVYGGKDYPHPYVEKIMTPIKADNESYTYGERLTRFQLTGDHLKSVLEGNGEIIDDRLSTEKRLAELRDKGILIVEDEGKPTQRMYLNQIEWINDTYKTFGHGNNQMVLQVAHPSDCTLKDPPMFEINRYENSG